MSFISSKPNTLAPGLGLGAWPFGLFVFPFVFPLFLVKQKKKVKQQTTRAEFNRSIDFKHE